MRKWLFLLRAFFPSWKFFDDVGPELRLEARYSTSGELGPWENCLPPIPRSFKNLGLNPVGNYLHACHNLINHLSSDIQEADLRRPEEVAKLTTYKLVRNLALFQLRQRHARIKTYQFRLSAMDFNQQAGEQILLSLIYDAEVES